MGNNYFIKAINLLVYHCVIGVIIDMNFTSKDFNFLKHPLLWIRRRHLLPE